MQKLLKEVLTLLSIAAGLFAGFLLYMTLNDYAPKAETRLMSEAKPDTVEVGKELKLTTWNIGYAGLDSGMDFFYDGGRQVRPDEGQYNKNIEAIASYLGKEAKRGTDFILVQEIDKDARRSYHQDQTEELAKRLGGYTQVFGKNYSVKWVPIPVTEPMGDVESGILTLSHYKPKEAKRHSFPFNFEWPLKVFMLDRCFTESRLPCSNGKDLVLINTHNSAFDDDGKLRKNELKMFAKFMTEEYKKGNYVIAGGDFNQSPAGLDTTQLGPNFDTEDYVAIPQDMLPQGWSYAFDNATASNRRVIAPYDPKTTKVTVIDFFIASPNIRVKAVKTDDLGFANSDHNPVRATVVLK